MHVLGGKCGAKRQEWNLRTKFQCCMQWLDLVSTLVFNGLKVHDAERTRIGFASASCCLGTVTLGIPSAQVKLSMLNCEVG